MQKVAVFGNAGGGKSTLSRKLSELTGLPLYVLDKIQYQPGGVKIAQAEYERIHQEIVDSDRWIIDGFGSIETLWPRLDKADSLIYVDLPLPVHFWWVTKRFVTGYFQAPAGWPERSPILKSSLSSYRVLPLCHQYLTPKYRDYVEQARSTRKVYHLRSTAEIARFFETLAKENQA
ncbi:MAG TPA: adenylate kinase [Leptolyngbyaceae cyanobacterium M33_DOE_097]|uniref:Adenylate kinase n=1 Tax=Oscillatoriales cyanobacterium SpSt-418 TaxID=2282169 RepID=A0A7C3PUQ0_9CYAN|nr:adenylate kinase [Leptolyngbyaceae cyanobacterium M33_DOE_097]